MGNEAGIRTGFGPCAAAAFCSVLMPGAGHLVIRARLRPAVIAAAAVNVVATIAVIAIVAPVSGKSDLAEVIADRGVFIGLGIALAAMAITRLFTAIQSAWLARPTNDTRLRLAAAAAAGVLVIGGVAPLAVAADYVWKADRAVENVFGSDTAPVAVPSPLPATTTVGTTITTADNTSTTTTVPDTGQNRVNVLLLGGDAGPGRHGLRTDSIIVVSIDSVTGDTVIISIPRNLERMPFPEGTALAERYPDGFDDLANAVWPTADRYRELVGGVDDAGSQAIKLGISQLLGIPIHNYVLVDMGGFVDVVDALGGIDINVTKRMPTPGNPADAKHDLPKFIEAGQQHMDGTLALAYSRTRAADSDTHRMARQQCVLGGIASAFTPMALVFGFTELMSAFGDSVSTDISRDELDDFARLLDRFLEAGGKEKIRALHLGRPLVDPYRWKLAEVRELVMETITSRTPNAPLLDEHC